MPYSRSIHLLALGMVSLGMVSMTLTGRLNAQGPYQATGIKIGEVSESSAIVWTRLTLRPDRNPADAPMVEFQTVASETEKKGKEVIGVVYPDSLGVGDIRDAVPGTRGQTRVLYRPAGEDEWRETGWQDVDRERDYTRAYLIDGLRSGTRYAVKVQSRASAASPMGTEVEGGFLTAPAADDPARVVFTVSTGQAYKDTDRPDGYKIYQPMTELDPSFFVHTGDIVYYDTLAKTAELARYHWQRTYSLPTNVAFHNRVASYFIKDDHDAWQNDCWPTMQNKKMFEFTFEQGLQIFREQVPMGDLTYRTRRWGKDLQVWMVEGRDFRSSNRAEDGPEKTIWGAEQLAWFKRTVEASDATFRILISPTPIVGPDRDNKHDNHSNADFKFEGDIVRDFIASQKNMVVVCGDRHWQYMSVHPTTKVREYCCGPASDQHAGGWQQDDFRPDFHRYLNVVGGFLSATVERREQGPTLTFRYHDVDGKVNYEDALVAE